MAHVKPAISVPLRLGKANVSLKPSLESTALSGPILRICRVCQVKKSQYTCPRCNIPYCSSQCYQSHGTRCTELFFKEHIESELKVSETCVEDRRKINDIILRSATEKQMDEEKMINEEEWLRFHDLSIKENLTLESLTEEEKQLFLRDIASGHLSKFVPLWNPWWTQSEEKYLQQTAFVRQGKKPIEILLENKVVNNHSNKIQVLKEEDNHPNKIQVLKEEDNHPNKIQVLKEEDEEEDEEALEEELVHQPDALKVLDQPNYLVTKEILSTLPSLSELIGSRVPPLRILSNNLVDLLFSYTTILRKFNGDWTSDAMEAASYMFKLSCVLQDDRKHESIENALQSSVCRFSQLDIPMDIPDLEQCRLILSDVYALLCSTTFTLDALYDMYQLFLHAVQEQQSLHKGTRKEKAKLGNAGKKIFFYICWIHDQDIHLANIAKKVYSQKIDFIERK